MKNINIKILDEVILLTKFTNSRKGHLRYQADKFIKAVRNCRCKHNLSMCDLMKLNAVT